MPTTEYYSKQSKDPMKSRKWASNSLKKTDAVDHIHHKIDDADLGSKNNLRYDKKTTTRDQTDLRGGRREGGESLAQQQLSSDHSGQGV